MKVVLNEIEMNTDVPDADGTYWYVTGMEGWDSPNPRQSTLDPSSVHGTTVTEALYGSRAVVLKGIAKATTEANFWRAYNGLLAATSSLRDTFDLVVSEDVDKRLGVVRAGMPRMEFIGVGSFEFEVPLLAQDPMKYAVTGTVTVIGSGATVSITNTGTYGTYPSMVASGTFNLKNVSTNLTTLTSETLPGGTVIDALRRTVYAGSVNAYNKIDPTSVWWALEPGVNSVKNNGTGTVTMTHHDAWI